MHRRTFLQAGLIAPLAVRRVAARPVEPVWRSFEITYNLEIREPAGTVRAWVPCGHHRLPGALDAPGPVTQRSRDLNHYLKPTRLIPIDGIVRETADQITKGHTTDRARARAIYDGIVENTVRDPEVKGCGLGDIRGMLEMKEPERQVRSIWLTCER